MARGTVGAHVSGGKTCSPPSYRRGRLRRRWRFGDGDVSEGHTKNTEGGFGASSAAGRKARSAKDAEELGDGRGPC